MRTHNVQHDQPLERCGRRSSLLLAHLVVLARAADVRRGKNQQEQEDTERGAVIHELHERRAYESTDATARHQQIDGGHDRQQTDQRRDDDDLCDEVVATPTRDAGVPNTSQQLLTVWMCHELYTHAPSTFVQ